MKKTILTERFQQLAGIKTLYEIDIVPSAKIMAAAFPTHEEYKTIYFGDDEDFREKDFEYIEAFTVAPYVFIEWDDTGIISYRYDSEEEFIQEFNEMGYGECYEEPGCSMSEIIEVIGESQPYNINPGLALIVNGKVIAQGGDDSFISMGDLHRATQDTSIAGMEDDPRMDPAVRSDFDDPVMEEGAVCEHCGQIHEGTCGYTTDTDGNELPTPGGTNRKGISAFNQSKRME